MKTRTNSIPDQLKILAETYVGDLSDIVFFDIETTGLSHKTAFLYLIGAAFMESGRFVLCQYLAEDLSEEEAVLKAFSERIKGKKDCSTSTAAPLTCPSCRRGAENTAWTAPHPPWNRRICTAASAR